MSMTKYYNHPPCPFCGTKEVGLIQYGYSDRDCEYRCKEGHTWESYPTTSVKTPDTVHPLNRKRL